MRFYCSQVVRTLNSSDAELQGRLGLALQLLQGAYTDALTQQGPFTLFLVPDAGFQRTYDDPREARLLLLLLGRVARQGRRVPPPRRSVLSPGPECRCWFPLVLLQLIRPSRAQATPGPFPVQ